MIKLCMWNDGTKRWYSNYHIHRANGPAVQYTNGEKSWRWYGQRITEYEHMMLSVQEQVNG